MRYTELFKQATLWDVLHAWASGINANTAWNHFRGDVSPDLKKFYLKSNNTYNKRKAIKKVINTSTSNNLLSAAARNELHTKLNRELRDVNSGVHNIIRKIKAYTPGRREAVLRELKNRLNIPRFK